MHHNNLLCLKRNRAIIQLLQVLRILIRKWFTLLIKSRPLTLILTKVSGFHQASGAPEMDFKQYKNRYVNIFTDNNQHASSLKVWLAKWERKLTNKTEQYGCYSIHCGIPKHIKKQRGDKY